jgi:hypothetical protein
MDHLHWDLLSPNSVSTKSGLPQIELTALVAAVAAFGLPCSNPERRDYAIGELPWPAAYIRSIEGDNVIALRRDIRNDAQRLPRLFVHELLHCGLYDARE